MFIYNVNIVSIDSIKIEFLSQYQKIAIKS